MIESPYLSVVVTARNDDHGGNLTGRMQAFVNGLLWQSQRHRVPCELVMVEWNPPPDRAPLADALDWSAQNEYCEVRIITVPAELHQRFEHWQALPLYQMIAKNVGIRRARGEFILATNIDILFSDELFRILAARALTTGKMYRADRWDVMADVPVDQPLDAQLAWCNSHLLRVNRRGGTYSLNPDGSMKVGGGDIVLDEPQLALGENWFTREVSGAEPFRWVDNDAEIVIAQAGQVRLSLDIEPGPGMDGDPLELEVRDAAGQVLASVVVERRGDVTLPLTLTRPDSHIFLHTDGGGARIAADLRTLNFRVFRAALSDGAPIDAKAESPAPPHTAPAKHSAISLVRLRRALTTVARAFFSTSEIRIPMSRERLRRLNLRQDESAISFDLGPLIRRRSRPVRNEILAGGLTAHWERGWYDLESYRGETFRWMQPQGMVLLFLPEAAGSRISLLVEAGPAVGYRGARLEVRNEAGDLRASVELRGRTIVDLPPGQDRNGVNGVTVLNLKVSGGGPPKATPGDSRTLALRLFRCELIPPAGGRAPQPFEAAPGSGIWCVSGFKARAGGLICAGRAEMAIRGAGKIAFQVSPSASPARLSIRNAAGGVLHDGPVVPGQEIELADAGGALLVLRFTADGPVTFAGMTNAVPDHPPVRFRFGGATAHAVHLHTNGCGDFTMMARGHWFDLRGYPEFDAFSMNIDSVLCWAAHHGGAREEMLPARIFHIEHGTGSGWTPEGEQKLYQRITAKGLPWLDFQTVLDWARAMHRLDLPMIFNGEQWGLERADLPELAPGRNACQARNV